jgi:putative SOS response-associated peptidase YedK
MPAGDPTAKLHDRQPAIPAPDAYDTWLGPETSAQERRPLLGDQNLDGMLQFHRVDRAVNASGRADKTNDDYSMIGPLNPL